MSIPAPEESIPSTPSAPSDKDLIDTPGDDNASLQPPAPLPYLTPLEGSPRDSPAPSGTAPLVPGTEKNLEGNVVDAQPERRGSLLKRPIFWFAVAAAVVAVALAVVLPVYFTVIKPKNNTSVGGGGGNHTGGDGGSNPPPKPPNGLTTGGDGSTVKMENGTEFTYRNPFGGFCAHIPFFFLPRKTSG